MSFDDQFQDSVRDAEKAVEDLAQETEDLGDAAQGAAADLNALTLLEAAEAFSGKFEGASQAIDGLQDKTESFLTNMAQANTVLNMTRGELRKFVGEAASLSDEDFGLLGTY